MIDPDKIKARLEREYEYVKSYVIGFSKVPVFLACNFEDDTFKIVSVYMDSEIGGKFSLDMGFDAEYVYKQFTAAQAEEFLNGMIQEIESGNVEVHGNVNPKKLH